MSVDHFFDGLMVMGPRSADGGKSAYAYAVEGGYTGTETEFAKRLAFLMNGAVVGYMEDSTIILSGNLAPGTYTFAYVVPKADGTTETVTIGTYTVEEESEEPETASYTVTFVADGITVDEVTYTKGDTELSRIPDVPAKEGCTGVWEAYDITNGGNITVNAVYTEIVVKPSYTNILTSGDYTVELNKRWSGSGKGFVDCNGMIGLKIPMDDVTNKTIWFSGFTANGQSSNQPPLWMSVEEDGTRVGVLGGTTSGTGNVWTSTHLVDEGNGVYSIAINATTIATIATAPYLVIVMNVNTSAALSAIPNTCIMTIDEPIE